MTDDSSASRFPSKAVEGILAAAFRDLFGGRIDVCAEDTWKIPSNPNASKPWLAVHVELNKVIVGPLVHPGDPGCPCCLQLRRERLGGGVLWQHWLRDDRGFPVSGHVPALLDPLAVEVVKDVASQLVEDEAAGENPRLVAVINLHSLEIRRHTLLADPYCEDCGILPDDSRGTVNRRMMKRQKISEFGSRGRNVYKDYDSIHKLYVDPFCGLIGKIDRGAEGGLVMAGAAMPLRFDGLKEPGYGRSRDYRTSEITAILEALERYGGVAPGGRRSVVRGSLNRLPEAVNPDIFGRHTEESYNDSSFRYRRFDPDQDVMWVWSQSLRTGEARLIPEALAYYYCHRLRPDDPVSYYEVSNGCALGSSLEEAALHGLMEVVERDAFLSTWYTQMTPNRIDLESCVNPLVCGQAEAIKARTGYDVFAFDITTDYGIPAVWTMAVEPGGNGPIALCTAGAGLDPERALLNAMNELGPILVDVIRRYPEEEAHNAEMVRDPLKVVTMPDHSGLYAHPDAFGRFSFLFGGPTIGIEAVGGDNRLRADRDDLAVDLAAAVARVGDAFIIDQTTPEHRAGGFSCVKVLVPGAVPMTFGYRNRRVDGLPRLRELPRRLGRLNRDLRSNELNPYPHPFP